MLAYLQEKVASMVKFVEAYPKFSLFLGILFFYFLALIALVISIVVANPVVYAV